MPWKIWLAQKYSVILKSFLTFFYSLHSLSMGPIHYRISWETSGPLPRDSSSDHTKEVIGGGVLMSSGANCPHLQVLTMILLAAATLLHLERPTFNNIIHY